MSLLRKFRPQLAVPPALLTHETNGQSKLEISLAVEHKPLPSSLARALQAILWYCASTMKKKPPCH